MFKKHIVGAVMMAALAFGTTHAQTTVLPDPSAVEMVEIANGLARPLYLTHAGDGSGRLFVVEQGGRIWIIQDGERLETPFLDLTPLVSPDANQFGYTERGLLGLAFHPEYAANGIFFVNYTDVEGNTVVARLRISADANIADPSSLEPILNIAQPFANHNGGHLAFGPDGYLYIGMGDGGSQGDPQNNGQQLDTLLGKLLRIDVDGEQGYEIPSDNPFISTSGAMPEIWAYGLRNPWRFTFDRATGDLLIGDVGGNAWEEINFQPAASTGGENYGWTLYEGNHPRSGVGTQGLTMPILEYSHSEGVSVTGGYVYRSSAIPTLQGVYFYADFGFGTIWAAIPNEDGSWQSQEFMRNTGYTISSFGEDEAGELYIVNYTGTIVQFVPSAS
jgi:glucose/arabinose dehydrogenase